MKFRHPGLSLAGSVPRRQTRRFKASCLATGARGAKGRVTPSEEIRTCPEEDSIALADGYPDLSHNIKVRKLAGVRGLHAQLS